MIGFDSTKIDILTRYKNKKLHHANLFLGKKGIGKASFVKSFLKDEILHRENHPDLLLIEKEEGKKNISIDKIRKISNFINQTSAICEDKFIVINSACELNKSSANALLKVLEEPHPNNYIFLICHNISKVIPTLRSRCQMIRIKDLSFEDFSQIVKSHKEQIKDDELKFLSQICDNSPASAINNSEELIENYQNFLNCFKNKTLNDQFIKKISDKRFPFEIFEKNYEFFSNRLLKFTSNVGIELFFNEEEVFLNIMKKTPNKKLFKLIEKNLESLRRVTSINMDKKLCVINIFNKIKYD